MKIEVFIDYDGTFTPYCGLPKQVERFKLRTEHQRSLNAEDQDDLLVESLSRIAREIPRPIITIVWHVSPLFDYQVYSFREGPNTIWTENPIGEVYESLRPHIFSRKSSQLCSLTRTNAKQM